MEDEGSGGTTVSRKFLHARASPHWGSPRVTRQVRSVCAIRSSSQVVVRWDRRTKALLRRHGLSDSFRDVCRRLAWDRQDGPTRLKSAPALVSPRDRQAMGRRQPAATGAG